MPRSRLLSLVVGLLRGRREHRIEAVEVGVVKLELHSIQCNGLGHGIPLELIDDRLIEGNRASGDALLAPIAVVTGVVAARLVICIIIVTVLRCSPPPPVSEAAAAGTG